MLATPERDVGQKTHRSSALSLYQIWEVNAMMVFGYVRVSTEGQLENYSIDEQSERIKSYCHAKGWTLLKTYTDGGYSGGNTNRPALQQMIKAIHNQKIDAVVVYRLDRLSRSQKDALTLIEDEFLAHGTDFVSVSESFDTTTPFGRAGIGMIAVFAQLEKDQIAERFTLGRIGRSKAGYFHGGGNSPLGYTYKDGMLEVDPYTAEIVRDIFTMFLSGQSINHIWNELKGRHPSKWSAAKISTVLRNSLYIGKVKFRGVEYQGVHEPLISEDVYYAANRLLESSERKSTHNTAQKTPFRAHTLLSGIIFCARCGARYSGIHGYYKCYSRSKSSKRFVVDPDCKNDNWLIEDLNDAIVTEIRNVASNKEAIAEIVTKSEDETPSIDAAAVQKRIGDIESQISKLIDLYQVSAIPMESLTQKIEALGNEKAGLAEMLDQQNQGAGEAAKVFVQALESFIKTFDGSSLEAQRLMVSTLIERVELDGQNIKIHWRV